MKYLVTILFLLLNQIGFGQTMNNTFITWEDFTKGFGSEMVSAQEVYVNMLRSGLTENALAKFDYHFVSDKKEKLEMLMKSIEEHYPYENIEIKKFQGGLWELRGITSEFPVSEDNLLYWGLDMYKRGYEFDCKIDAYGAMLDPENPTLPNLSKEKQDEYYDKGITEYNRGNISGGIINLNLALSINSKDPDAYYSRAIMKAELYTWKDAIKDYDKAIEFAPDFISAYINRGALKDDYSDYEGAISDYNKLLEFDNLTIEDKQLIYFNRGNSRLNMDDKANACKDWNTAKELGADDAQEIIDKFCK